MRTESHNKTKREEFAERLRSDTLKLTDEEIAMIDLRWERDKQDEAQREFNRCELQLQHARERLRDATIRLENAEQHMLLQLEEARKKRGITKDATITETTFPVRS